MKEFIVEIYLTHKIRARNEKEAEKRVRKKFRNMEFDFNIYPVKRKRIKAEDLKYIG